MIELQRWLNARARSLARRPQLDEALLCGRFWTYASYRLRYLGIRLTFRTLLRAAELAFFMMPAWSMYLGAVLVVRHVMGTLGGAWWGGLEVMRRQVRQAAADKHMAAARRIIDGWLLASSGAAVLATGLTYLAVRNVETAFGFFRAYAMACAVRLGVELVVRCYHSGIYALSRVYRPLWSIIVLDAIDVGGVILLWPHFGPLSMILVLLGVAALSAGISIYYCHQAYGRAHFPPRSLRHRVRRPIWPTGRDLAGFAQGAATNVMTDMESLLLVVMLVVAKRSPAVMAMAAVFHLAGPILSAAAGWSRLFYFDFARLELRYHRMLQERFERQLRRGAGLLGGALGVLAAGWVAYHQPRAGGWLPAAFFVAVAARARLGLAQMQAFSYGRYRFVVATGGVVMGGLALVALVHPAPKVLILSWAALVAITTLVARPPGAQVPPDPPVLPPARWLARLLAVAQPVRLGTAVVSVLPRLRTARAAAALIADQLPAGGQVALATAGRLAWFEPVGDGPLLRRTELAARTAGVLGRLTVGPTLDPADVAPVRRFARDSLGVTDAAPASVDALRAAFEREFSDGWVLDVRDGVIEWDLASSVPGGLSRVLGQVRHAVAGVGRAPRSVLDVTVYCPGGEPLLIFVVPRACDAKRRELWRRRVETESLAATLPRAVD